MPETVKLFGSTKKLIDKKKKKKKKGENAPSFEVARLVLVQYDLVDN